MEPELQRSEGPGEFHQPPRAGSNSISTSLSVGSGISPASEEFATSSDLGLTLRFLFGAKPTARRLGSGRNGRFNVAAKVAARVICVVRSKVVWDSRFSRTVRFQRVVKSKKLRVRLRLTSIVGGKTLISSGFSIGSVLEKSCR